MEKKNFKIDFENPLTYNDKPSNVYKAIDISSKIEYAIKIIPKTENIEKSLEIFEYLNNCENSIKYFGNFSDDDYTYIILELCDYSLAKKIFDKKKEKENFSIKEIKEIFLDLNKALYKMREKRMIHGNLKPENILAKTINNILVYKLTDYGIIKQPIKKESLNYQAPEYDRPIDKSKMDLWSIGIILYEMHFGTQPPFPISRKKLEKSDNKFFDDLIRNLLVENPFGKKAKKKKKMKKRKKKKMK